MSQSSGFLRELEGELADEPTNDGPSPSVSSSGEAAVSSLPPKPPQRNAIMPSSSYKRKETCNSSEASPSNGSAMKRLTSCRHGSAPVEDVASGSGQCTHEVIYRGLCGMCALLSCALLKVHTCPHH